VNTWFLLWNSTEVGAGIPLVSASAGADYTHLSLLSLSGAAAQPCILFVRWTPFQELSTTENADPDTTTRMSSTLETNAVRAESAYRNTLQDFIGVESTSSTARWDMEKHDHISLSVLG